MLCMSRAKAGYSIHVGRVAREKSGTGYSAETGDLQNVSFESLKGDLKTFDVQTAVHFLSNERQSAPS